MRSDHHCGLRSHICGKMASSLSSLRSNEYFYYIIMTILRGDFYVEKLSPVFHTYTMRTLQTWRITLLSFSDDNIKSRIAIWKIK